MITSHNTDFFHNLSLTDTTIKKIMKECGIDDIDVLFKGQRYFFCVGYMDEQKWNLVFDKLEKPMLQYEYLQLVITIDQKKYLLSMEIGHMVFRDRKLEVECKIVGQINLELEQRIQDVLEKIGSCDRRKNSRIQCTNDNLVLFDFIPRVSVKAREDGKEYEGYVFDLSEEGIGIFLLGNFLEVKAIDIQIKLHFGNPIEIILLAGKIKRKEVVDIDGTDFVEIGVHTVKNEHLHNRILRYFEHNHGIYTTISI